MADQLAQFAVMLLLVRNHLFENDDAWLVPQFLQLLPIARNIAALVDLQPPQRHLRTAQPVHQRIGIASVFAFVLRQLSAQLANALRPQRRVLRLLLGHVPQRLPAHRIVIALGQRVVGVEAAHLRLPVFAQRLQHLLLFLRQRLRHAC